MSGGEGSSAAGHAMRAAGRTDEPPQGPQQRSDSFIPSCLMPAAHLGMPIFVHKNVLRLLRQAAARWRSNVMCARHAGLNKSSCEPVQ